MSFLRFLFLVVGILFTQRTHAQWTILYQSQDMFTTPDTATQIRSIESRGILSKYLIVRYKNAPRRLIAKKAIWGYIDDNNVVWRSFDKELFRLIKYNGVWAEYAINRLRAARLNTDYMATMYSRTLDSKIKLNWSEAMADAPPDHIVR